MKEQIIHAWDEPKKDEKTSLLPSVKPEFYSSPHAWELEEPAPNPTTRKPKPKMKKKASKNVKGTGSQSVFDKLGDLAGPIEDMEISDSTSTKVKQPEKALALRNIESIKLVKQPEHRAPPLRKHDRSDSDFRIDQPSPKKEEKSIFDRLGPKPNAIDPVDTPSKKPTQKAPELKLKKPEQTPKSERPIVQPKSKKKDPNVVVKVPVGELASKPMGNWADDQSPMDYSTIPIWTTMKK